MSALANMTLVKLNLSRTSAGILTSQGCGREVRCSLWECFEALVVTAVLLLHCHYEVEPVAASQPRTRVREYISLVKVSVSVTCQPHTYFSTLCCLCSFSLLTGNMSLVQMLGCSHHMSV